MAVNELELLASQRFGRDLFETRSTATHTHADRFSTAGALLQSETSGERRDAFAAAATS